MKFANLQELIQTSSSSRMYLLSLPVDIQLQICMNKTISYTVCTSAYKCGISDEIQNMTTLIYQSFFKNCLT